MYRACPSESNICSPLFADRDPDAEDGQNLLDIEHLFDKLDKRHEHLFDQVCVTPGSYIEPRMAKTPPGNVQQEEKV
jgi:hypothetical protein